MSNNPRYSAEDISNITERRNVWLQIQRRHNRLLEYAGHGSVKALRLYLRWIAIGFPAARAGRVFHRRLNDFFYSRSEESIGETTKRAEH